VRLPDEVTFDAGAFGTVGAIALQGVRLAAPTLGESVVVIGLGLIGQLAVQLLNANGCRVFGMDLDQEKIQLAKRLGAEDGCAPDVGAKQRVLEWSRGRGADAVLITAATSSSEPVELAGEISRAKGRVIVVGAVGLNLPRKPYYDRELTFRISMSYGPGRYDREYEERGHDYPVGYVRWTKDEHRVLSRHGREWPRRCRAAHHASIQDRRRRACVRINHERPAVSRRALAIRSATAR